MRRILVALSLAILSSSSAWAADAVAGPEPLAVDVAAALLPRVESPVPVLEARALFAQERGPWFLIGRQRVDQAPSGPLIHQENLVYLGAFRAPSSGGYGYSGGGLAYDPDGNSGQGSLLVTSDFQNACEMSIPDLVITTDLSLLHRATNLTTCWNGWFDDLEQGISAGHSYSNMAGIHKYHSKIFWGGYRFYDIGECCAWVVKNSGTLGTVGNSSGPYRVGNYFQAAISGWMADIPSEWQTRLGGPVMAGTFAAITNIQRAGTCPSMFAVDPDTFTTEMPYPLSVRLLDCPDDDFGGWFSYNNHIIGGIAGSDVVYNPDLPGRIGYTAPLFGVMSQVGGAVVAPNGSRSVLLVGTSGIGVGCYDTPDACGDLDNAGGGTKGDHAYPYVARIWAMDLLDLQHAKEGTLAQSAVRPYDYWNFTLPFCTWGQVQLFGADYDPVHNKIYMAQKRACSDDTVIHVYTVQ